ncbi:MAG: hypothetical protein QOG30_1753 [Acidimicrobiaceae bacterium]
MSRRIEVELTSARDDGSWTWRAAGAREPRGVVAGDLLPVGSKVGDVMRAEADFDLDGVSIISIAPKQEKKRNEAERIEIIGQPRRDDQLVTSTLASRPKGDRRDSRGRGDRSDGPGRPGRPGRSGRPERAPRGEGEGDAGRPKERAKRPPRSAERRPPRARPDEPAKPKPKRLRPGRIHRAAVLEELPPEHRPIAEQVLAGDIPAVRQAIEKENSTRTAAGQPTINGDQLLAIAEKLRPQLRTAEWRDKAEAAMADVDEIDLRDLRSVVVAADSAARDDDTRALATQLREALTKRVDAEQAAWVAELTTALDEGRVVRALRLSSRPPKAGVILDPALTTRLAEGACASLTADAPAERWAAVLDATAFSPVRLAVKPQSLPEKPSDEIVASAKKLASRLPQVAAAFGIEINDAPRSRGASKPRPVPRPPRIPPPPPMATEPVAPPASAEPVAPTEPVAPPASAEPVAPTEPVEPAEPAASAEVVQEVERSTEDEVAENS